MSGPLAQSSAGAAVELIDLVKRYHHDEPAVDHINLSVHPGEFVTMLGPSGSGKSTTLMAIAGFVEATSGDIRIDGRSLRRVPPHKRGIGVVFQNYALFPHLTVAANVAFPLKSRGWNKDRISSAVEDALRLVRLEGLGDRHPAQLSGGQQQRVALARATVYRPRLLLMDEPLGALDRQLRQTMQFEITKIRQALGATIISVTHDQEEALTMSDRVVVMKDGKIVQEATPREIYERPTAAFVASFVGETNLIKGVVKSVGEDTSHVVVASGDILSVKSVPAVGAEVSLSIRPESWRMSGASPTAPNMLLGRVEGAAYTGGATRYVVAVAGEPIVIRVPAADDRVRPNLGDEVLLSVSPDDIVVVPASGNDAQTHPLAPSATTQEN